MNLEHMRRICGWGCAMLGQASLDNFEIGPDGRGYINIRAKAGDKVLGVLYQMNQDCLDAMDEFEGYPEVFSRREVEVEDMDGQKFTAWVYMEKPEFFGNTKVREGYLKRVICGARENHLPEEWIEFLSKMG